MGISFWPGSQLFERTLCRFLRCGCDDELRLLHLDSGHSGLEFFAHERPELADSSGSTTFAESCLWKCEAVRANGGLRVSLRTHTIGPIAAGPHQPPPSSAVGESERGMQPDHEAVRQNVQDERTLVLRRKVAEARTQRPPRDYIRLPVRSLLNSGHRVIGRQDLQCPHPGLAIGIGHDEGSDEARLERYLAARETLKLGASEPLVGVIGLAGPFASEPPFHHLRCGAAEDGGIDRLPECQSKLRLAAKPQCARHF
jgi:hypothetical protein